jgi:hypothetical protein
MPDRAQGTTVIERVDPLRGILDDPADVQTIREMDF